MLTTEKGKGARPAFTQEEEREEKRGRRGEEGEVRKEGRGRRGEGGVDEGGKGSKVSSFLIHRVSSKRDVKSPMKREHKEV